MSPRKAADSSPTLDAVRSVAEREHEAEAAWTAVRQELRAAVVAAVAAGDPIRQVALAAGVERRKVYAWVQQDQQADVQDGSDARS